MSLRKLIGMTERAAAVVAMAYCAYHGMWEAGTFWGVFGVFSAVTRDNET